MTLAISGGVIVRRQFDPIKSIEFSRRNILTGADFKQPRIKSWLERLVEFLNQKAMQP